MKSIAHLPDWRAVSFESLAKDEYSSSFNRGSYAIMEYRDDRPVRNVANVSRMYRFVAPRDYFSDIAKIAARHMQGDVSIMNIRVLSSKVFVHYKLPSMFALTSDPRDSFGLTLVACNPYSGKEAHKIGAGAIRGFCDNGCYFGQHEALTYDHKRKRDEVTDDSGKMEERIVDIIDRAVPLAQVYVDRMVGVKMSRYSGAFDGKCKAKSLLESAKPKQAELAILLVPGLTLNQRIQVTEQSHSQDSDEITVYELWNAFTYVATRLSNAGSTHKMMSAINDAFSEGSTVDKICAAKDMESFRQMVPLLN